MMAYSGGSDLKCFCLRLNFAEETFLSTKKFFEIHFGVIHMCEAFLSYRQGGEWSDLVN